MAGNIDNIDNIDVALYRFSKGIETGLVESLRHCKDLPSTIPMMTASEKEIFGWLVFIFFQFNNSFRTSKKDFLILMTKSAIILILSENAGMSIDESSC